MVPVWVVVLKWCRWGENIKEGCFCFYGWWIGIISISLVFKSAGYRTWLSALISFMIMRGTIAYLMKFWPSGPDLLLQRWWNSRQAEVRAGRSWLLWCLGHPRVVLPTVLGKILWIFRCWKGCWPVYKWRTVSCKHYFTMRLSFCVVTIFFNGFNVFFFVIDPFGTRYFSGDILCAQVWVPEVLDWAWCWPLVWSSVFCRPWPLGPSWGWGPNGMVCHVVPPWGDPWWPPKLGDSEGV